MKSPAFKLNFVFFHFFDHPPRLLYVDTTTRLAKTRPVIGEKIAGGREDVKIDLAKKLIIKIFITFCPQINFLCFLILGKN
jgi:hypothetical protein